MEKAVFDPGYEAIHRFISQAKDHLKEHGRLLIGFSTILGKFDTMQKFLKEAGFSVRLVSRSESHEIVPVSFEIFEAVSFETN